MLRCSRNNTFAYGKEETMNLHRKNISYNSIKICQLQKADHEFDDNIVIYMRFQDWLNNP